MDEGLIDLGDLRGYKRMVLRLRWATLVVTSYLILFGRGIHTPQLFPSLLILFYLASNLFAYFLPPAYFLKLHFFYLTLLFDTAMVSLGIYLTAQFNTDFYLVYFLIIIFASIARSLKLLMVNAVIICGIYGWFLWSKGLSMEDMAKGIILRIPFFFIMNLFYGFLVQSFEERTKRMRKEFQEVEESEERYRRIVESAHDAVAVLDEMNRIKWFNGRLLQLTERLPEELMGMELTKLIEGLDDEAIQKLMRGSSSGEKLNIQEVDVFRKNGERRRAEVSAARLSLLDHKAYTIFYLKDITDREKMEDRLIRSEKLRALGEMAAGVAHDFNNVLGAILGRVQLIKLGLGRTEEGVGAMPHETLQRELSVIEQAALDGAHTIKKIQEFTRQKGNECLFVPLNMNEIVEGAIELMKTKIKDEADERGISIKVQTINNEISSVMGNPAELREVLINLMMNSIDAMPKGGTITFKTGTENGHVSIEVVDDGIGMPESVRKRIFDPFFTTKGVQRSGLGLSISYGIIHRHQGEIRAQSREGMGTTFRIELPISKKERDRREEENGERSSAIFHHPGH